MKTLSKSAFTGTRILILVATFIGFNVYSQELPRHMNVLAVNGLNMRTQPDANARIITKVSYGQRVEILEATEVNLQLGWISDRWYKVRYHGREGYLFGGYLSTMEAPEAVQEFVELREIVTTYVASMKQVGGVAETIERTQSDTLRHRLVTFENGVEMEWEDTSDRKVTRLLVHSTVEKTLILLEALLKTAGRASLIETFRFVQNTDGTLKKVSTANGTVRVQQLNDEIVELRLIDFAEANP
jgi:uncharacterized protein YgiM (DUF1202 family)